MFSDRKMFLIFYDMAEAGAQTYNSAGAAAEKPELAQH
jgi:hypothetical protein